MIIKTFYTDGTPIDIQRMYTYDENNIPFFSEWSEDKPGEWTVSYNQRDIKGVEILWEAPGFGKLFISADNEGKGYKNDAIIDFRQDALKSKIKKLDNRIKFIDDAGEKLSDDIIKKINKVKEMFSLSEELIGEELATQLDKCLCKALWAGEELELEFANINLNKKSSEERKNILFGGFYFGDGSKKDKLTDACNYYYEKLYNFSTIGFYHKGMEPERGVCDWKSKDNAVAFVERMGLTMKGHPLSWWCQKHGFSDWMMRLSFESAKKVVYQQIYDTVDRFKGRVKYWDVINEAHNPPWTGADLYLPFDKVYETTALACRAVRDADPNAVRIVNINHPWGVYRNHREFVKTMHPYEYVKGIIDRGIEFEVIGIQLYSGVFEETVRDLSEVSEMLDMYTSLGKKVHLTEVNNPSSVMPLPPIKGHYEGRGIEAGGIWHRPWDQEGQADWYEQLYTLACSKPNLEAITNCDFTDNIPAYMPHGGLLDKNDEPKKSYWRLYNLFKKIHGEEI